MINKPMLNIVYAIALLCPVLSAAACLDSNDPAKNMTTGDCRYKAEYYLAGLAEAEINQPASTQKTGNQSEFSAFEGAEVSNVGPKVDVQHLPKNSETDLDNFEWMSVDWYEAY
jgi:hypothetical protein